MAVPARARNLATADLALAIGGSSSASLDFSAGERRTTARMTAADILHLRPGRVCAPDRDRAVAAVVDVQRVGRVAAGLGVIVEESHVSSL